MSGDRARKDAQFRPVSLRHEDVELLRAGEMPEEFIARVLDARPSPVMARGGKKEEKLRPIEMSEEEVEAAARGDEISEHLTERLEEAGKLDPNRKRAAGTKAARPEKTPPGQRRSKS